jgi:regulator of protease activity HflC (stomatin/prohibitin superfamily)
MRYVVGIVFAVALIVMLFNTGCSRIEPGYVGIKVNYSGSDKGVQDYPVVTGWQFYNRLTQTVLEYPTFVQTAVWTHDKKEESPENEEVSFSSKDSMVIYGDVSLSYQLVAEKVPAFYTQFRNDDLKKFTHGFLRNVARDAFNTVASNYTVEELYSTKRGEFLSKVKEKINAEVGKYGVQLDQLGFVGALRLPDSLVSMINQKIQATQNALKVENELRVTNAEVAKQVAVAEGSAKAKIAEAEGIAKANKLLQESATPSVLALKKLDIEKIQAERWNGELPHYVTNQTPLPILNMK